jgi:hypothetical protein
MEEIDVKKYKALFAILDAIFNTLDFIRMIPWHLWFFIQCAYLYAVYRPVILLRAKLYEKRWN